MANRTKRKKRLLPKLLAVVVLLGLIIVALWYFLAGRLPTEPGSPLPQPGPDEPQSQPADCADVAVIAIPGTWESATGDDPYNPTANPASLMLNVTRPLQGSSIQLGPVSTPSRTWLSSPIPLRFPGRPAVVQQQSIRRCRGGEGRTVSRCGSLPADELHSCRLFPGCGHRGRHRIRDRRGQRARRCRQGARVTLIADGRRDGTSGVDIGPPVDGVGAEVALGASIFPESR